MAQKRMVLLGAPGVGKGTQAKKFQEAFSLAHISTGDMLRDAVRQGTDLGIKARQYMETGELVPDDLIIDLVDERLGEDDCEDGFILDGFPRTVIQAEKLDMLLRKRGIQLDDVVSIDVPNEAIITRLSKRRVCDTCGYVLESDEANQGDPCPKCGEGTVIRRKDDEPESIRRRLEVYDEKTRSLIQYYDGRRLLRTVDGTGNPGVIFDRLVGALGLA